MQVLLNITASEPHTAGQVVLHVRGAISELEVVCVSGRGYSVVLTRMTANGHLRWTEISRIEPTLLKALGYARQLTREGRLDRGP